MYLIRRTSTVPNSPLQVQLDGPPEQGGGFQQGGVFYFQPAGQDGDRHQVSEHGALTIMGDAGLAQHFECEPPLGDGAFRSADDVAAEQDALDAARAGQPGSTSGPAAKPGRGGRDK